MGCCAPPSFDGRRRTGGERGDGRGEGGGGGGAEVARVSLVRANVNRDKMLDDSSRAERATRQPEDSAMKATHASQRRESAKAVSQSRPRLSPNRQTHAFSPLVSVTTCPKLVAACSHLVRVFQS